MVEARQPSICSIREGRHRQVNSTGYTSTRSFCHTGALETYHSMMLKYCPKRLEFEYASMVSSTQLAVVDNNVNIGRNQKTDANGKLRNQVS